MTLQLIGKERNVISDNNYLHCVRAVAVLQHVIKENAAEFLDANVCCRG